MILNEIVQEPLVFLNPWKIKKIIGFIKKTIEAKEFFGEYLREYLLPGKEVIFYTYWSTYITLALAILTKNDKKKIVVTRMHGSDLYSERGFVVCQRQIVKKIRHVYCVSESGRNYLGLKYKDLKHKFRLAPIGISKQDLLNPWSYSPYLHIVSCSVIDENKRVGLIFDALLILARTGRRISWSHFGSGILEENLREKIRIHSSSNLRCDLYGQVSPEFIRNFYRTRQVDVFATTSASEGGRPVSIQEALSFGIPVIGTAVGGIPELVSSDNGFLLTVDPTPVEISEALKIFLSNPELVQNMRKSSYEKWMLYCDKDMNCSNFIKELNQL